MVLVLLPCIYPQSVLLLKVLSVVSILANETIKVTMYVVAFAMFVALFKHAEITVKRDTKETKPSTFLMYFSVYSIINL